MKSLRFAKILEECFAGAPHLALEKAILQSSCGSESNLLCKGQEEECSSLTHVWLPQNSPNDLQMLSDAPAHHLFCLLPPVPPTQNALPEVLAVIQVSEQRHPCGSDLGNH